MDLVGDGGLTAASKQAIAARQPDPAYATWSSRLADLIGGLQRASNV